MHPERKPVFSKKQHQRVHSVSLLHHRLKDISELFSLSRGGAIKVTSGSCRNDDRAISRAADCTVLAMEIDAEFDEGFQ